MKKSIIVLSLVLFFGGCNSAQKESLIKIPVTVQKANSDQLTPDIKIAKMVALSDSIPVGTVRKIHIYNDHIYLLNKKVDELLCYDADGQLAYCIRGKGRGPQEYVAIQNFFMNEETGEICILSPDNRLLQYNASTGEFLRAVPTGRTTMMPLDGIILEDGSLALYTMGPEWNLEIIRKGADSAAKFIPFVQARDMTFSDRAFSAEEGHFIFAHGTSDYIYKITPEGAEQKYYVDFGGCKIAPELYISDPAAVEAIYTAREVACKLDDLLETDNYVLFSYLVFPPASYNVTKRYAIFDKATSQVMNFVTPHPFFPVAESVEGRFVSVVNPSAVAEWGGSEAASTLQNFMAKHQLSGESNPIIIHWTLQ